MSDATYQQILTDFAAAITADDEQAAQAASSPDAWHLGGETPRALHRQSQGPRGFTLTPTGELTTAGDKAWGVCQLTARPKDGDTKAPRALGRIRVLMTPAGVVGVANDPTVVSAWMDSMITASARMASLPVSDLGQRWADRVRAAVITGGDVAAAVGDLSETGAMSAMMLTEVLGVPDAIIATLPSRWIPAAGRIAAGFLVTTPTDDLGSEIWATLQTTPEGGLSLVGTAAHMSIGQLVQGAKRVGETKAPAAQAAAPSDAASHPDPFAHAVAAARGELSTAPTAGPGGSDVDDVVGPTPLVDHPDAVTKLREGIHAALKGVHEGAGPTNLAEVKGQAWDMVKSAVASVTKTVAKPSEPTANPDLPEV